MVRPKLLKIGDKVAVTAPSGKVEKDRVLKGVEIIQSWGLKVEISEHCFDNYYMFSSQDHNRLKDLQNYIDSEEIKAIFAARGGYGVNRIIDNLKLESLIKNPKWLIGFSDITLLHMHINKLAKIESIHGPMPNTIFENSIESIEALKQTLFNGKIQYNVNSEKHNRIGSCEGTLFGGNLAIICSAIGTNSFHIPKSGILFIEDIGEHHYKIDRMMYQLKRARVFDQINGLIVGSFSDTPDNKDRFGSNIEELIMEVTREYNLPTAFNFSAGHIGNNLPLIMGANTSLKIDQDITTITF
jgi:muramoyltetrapeptide carboxypeptidase